MAFLSPALVYKLDTQKGKMKEDNEWNLTKQEPTEWSKEKGRRHRLIGLGTYREL